jgi:hypothetical protein
LSADINLHGAYLNDMIPENWVELFRQNTLLLPAIILAPIAVGIAAFIIMKVLEACQERMKLQDWQTFQEAQERAERAEASKPEEDAGTPAITGGVTVAEKPIETKPFSAPKTEKDLTMDELRLREGKLQEREEKLKRHKLMELEEKGKLVERKHITDVVKEERKITDAIEEKREKEQQAEEMRNNRKRLVKLIELAEDRYKDGLMSEKNFRNIMGGYQKELVEVDVELSKLRGYSI